MSLGVKRGVSVIVFAKYANVVLALAANGVLSRILSARDYGVVSVVMVFVVLFQLISDIGLTAGVIQHKEIGLHELCSLFSVTVYVAIGVVVLMFPFAHIVAWFFDDGIYIGICLMLSIAVFFSTLNMIPNAILLRKKAFATIGVRIVVASLFSYFVAVIVALLGGRYYSLIAQAIANSSVLFVWNISGSGLGFRLRIDTQVLRRLLRYSGFDFGFGVVSYFARNVDNFLVGKIIGPEALGVYGKAYSLMLYPVSYITGAINPVLHPILSEHQDDKKYILDRYLELFKLLSLLGVFFSLFFYFGAREIVLSLFGSTWLEVVPCVSALSLSIWFQITSSSCGAVYKSVGRTDLMFASAVVYVPIQVLAIVVGVLSGDLERLSWMVSLSFVAKFVTEYSFLFAGALGYSLRDFCVRIIPDISVGALVCAGMSAAVLVSIDNIVLSLLYKGAVCLFAFIISVWATGQGKCLSVLKRWK